MKKSMIQKILILLGITFSSWCSILYAPNNGLVNQNGNDCFFSASFQCLSQIKPFIEFFDKNPEFQNGKIQKRFYEFVQAMRQGSSAPADYNEKDADYKALLTRKYKWPSTRKFRKFIVDELSIEHMRTGQKDAQEFLGFLLEALISRTPLHNIIVKAITDICGDATYKKLTDVVVSVDPTTKKKTFKKELKDVNLGKDIAFKVESILGTDIDQITDLKSTILSNPTIPEEFKKIAQEEKHASKWVVCNKQIKKLQDIYKIFFFRAPSTLEHTPVVISKPGEIHTSKSKGSISSLALPIKGTTLKECLDGFFEKESMNSAEYPFCSKCNASPPTTKQFSLETVPQVLIISLKRFTNLAAPDEEPNIKKITSSITFEEKLSLQTNNGVTHKFNLFGIVCQVGELSSGHYWAYAKDMTKPRNWYYYNDESENGPLSHEEIQAVCNQTSEAGYPYVLFYELETAASADEEVDESMKPTDKLSTALKNLRGSLTKLRDKLATTK